MIYKRKHSSEMVLDQELLNRFDAYEKTVFDWGPLHLVLADDNLEDYWIQECLNKAIEAKDDEGAALARLLLRMSEEQRAFIGSDRRGYGSNHRKR